MVRIDWKVRIKNKAFWLTLVPAVFVLIRFVIEIAGVDFDAVALESKLLDAVNAVFTILAILGIVVDPTTKGFQDGAKASGEEGGE